MFTSIRYSYWGLRLGLAAVFLWFGIDKMFHPVYWLNGWVPDFIVSMLSRFGVSGTQFIYINGIFEILVGLSLLTGVFNKFFSVLAVIFLVSIFVFIGFNQSTIRDLGLMGGLVAVIFWPSRRSGF
ncbi:MAG TPA: DoxX family membrane protein [Candidatus Paceibacterota bacterium]